MQYLVWLQTLSVLDKPLKGYILLCSRLSRTDFVPMKIRTTQPVIFRACKKAKERANRVSGFSCLLKPFVS